MVVSRRCNVSLFPRVDTQLVPVDRAARLRFAIVYLRSDISRDACERPHPRVWSAYGKAKVTASRQKPGRRLARIFSDVK